MSLPASAPYVVIGAGMHGLSTALHLARELKARGTGSGSDIAILDKATPGAGATGIASGVVRNNYFQPAMNELMQACIEVWESDPRAYHYHSVGCISLGPRAREGDLSAVHERHQWLRYRSDLIIGGDAVDRYMKSLFPDWRARGVTVCLHEHRGGFAFNIESVRGLRDKCLAEGVTIHPWTEVTGFRSAADGTITAVETDHGPIAVGEQVVVAPGPWAKRFWMMLELPLTIGVRTHWPSEVHDRPMWTYRNLQEGEIAIDPLLFATQDGSEPPVINLDSDAPLHAGDGTLVTGKPWGVSFKRDRHGIQGGVAPLRIDGDVELDPYPLTTDVDPSFPDRWCAALSHTMGRFEGCRAHYKMVRSGGLGAFTADNFPVFDYLRPNLYAILDSNHGYKMIGVGREVARVLVGGYSSLLLPFRFSRFVTGDLHPISHSPYPWS